MKKRPDTTESLQKIIVSAIGFFMVILVMIPFVLDTDAKGSIYSGRSVACASGWLDENGNEAALSGISSPAGSSAVFRQTFDLSQMNGQSLCFISHNISFSVYAGELLIYDFHPTLGGYYGKHYGDYIHTVALPSNGGETELRIEGTILFQSNWTGFDDMKLQDSGEYISDITSKNSVSFMICILIFGFGIILLLFGIFESLLRVPMLETICLGVITILLSLWTNAQTKILHIITENSAALRIIDYVVFCLLPIPTLLFVASFTRSRGNKMLRVCIALCALNFCGQAIGVPLGWFDYSDALIVSHLLILLGVLLIAYLIIRAINERRIDRSQSAYLISALAVIVCSGIIDMLRYYLGHYPDSSYVTRMGLMVFVTILTIYELRQLIAVRIKSREAEMMQRLAMEDSLTGVQSRTAFVACEKALLERREGVCLFVHFDVNFLKTVNDTYGHSEGDRHIIAAATVIKESFGAKGKCFRVGGDEFFAVLDRESCRSDYDEGVEKFLRLQAEYNSAENPPVPLVIAHGMAEYDCSSGDPETAERLADSRMYEDKKRLKAQS